MTKEQIVALAIRLFAVFLLIYGLRSIGSVIPISYLDDIPASAWIIVAALAVVFFGIVLLLWFFPLLVTRKLMPSDEVKEGESIASIEDIDVIAYSILGLWVLSSAVPDMVYWIIMWSMLVSQMSGDLMITEQKVSTIVTVFELIMGVWLLMGAKGLRGVIRKMRFAGS